MLLVLTDGSPYAMLLPAVKIIDHVLPDDVAGECRTLQLLPEGHSILLLWADSSKPGSASTHYIHCVATFGH